MAPRMSRCWALLCRTLRALHASELCHAYAAAQRLRLLGRARSRAGPGHDGPNERPRLPACGAHEPLPAACAHAHDAAHAAALSAHRWSPRSWRWDMVPQRRHLLACPEQLWPKGKYHCQEL